MTILELQEALSEAKRAYREDAKLAVVRGYTNRALYTRVVELRAAFDTAIADAHAKVGA